MQYLLTYKTSNLYEVAVPELYLDFLILPASEGGRTLVSNKIWTCPKWKYDMPLNKYGYSLIRFSRVSNTREFTLEMNCTVNIEDPKPLDRIPQESFKPNEVLSSPHFIRSNYFFLRNTGLTELDDQLLSETVRTQGEPVMDYLRRLNGKVYKMMDYLPGITETTTSAMEAIGLGKGVCQDFTHIFLGYCRSAGIPARYVSGYLHVGKEDDAQLHAWVETLVPGIGWVGIDPTNHLFTNENYIKIAHGIDYTECASLRGIIRGLSDHTTTYEVSIQQQTQ